MVTDRTQRRPILERRTRPNLPVGLTLTTQDIQTMGAPANVDKWRGRLYGDWINVARTHADFIGIQTYSASG